MDVCKTAVRHRYICWLEVDLLVYLDQLAKQARLGHLGPAELGSDEALCYPHPWVEDGVQRLS